MYCPCSAREITRICNLQKWQCNLNHNKFQGNTAVDGFTKWLSPSKCQAYCSDLLVQKSNYMPYSSNREPLLQMNGALCANTFVQLQMIMAVDIAVIMKFFYSRPINGKMFHFLASPTNSCRLPQL